MIRKLPSWLRPAKPPRRPAHPLSVRLGGEQLEAREVPATFRWNTRGDADNVWGRPSNWDIQLAGGAWVSARPYNNYPGKYGTTDTAEFWGSYSYDCNLNVPVTLYRMETKPGYGATINVNNPLTISGTDLNSMLIAKGEGALRGLRPGGGITMAGQSVFEWNSGWLLDITVLVTRTDDARYARAYVVPYTGDRQQNNATLDVFGVLAWSGGNVQVAPSLGAGVPQVDDPGRPGRPVRNQHRRAVGGDRPRPAGRGERGVGRNGRRGGDGHPGGRLRHLQHHPD
ncbi:MAG: hypothetical protein K2X87_28480 [Gemmataceae bacterium]|nr:hypothetical protein [Gemmataceae bacterium]